MTDADIDKWVPREDRLAVAILSLTPTSRIMLNVVARAKRPVTLRTMAESYGGDKGAVHRRLVALWSAGLLTRTVDARGPCRVSYTPGPDVCRLRKRYRSLAPQRVGFHRQVGLRVLAAARMLVAARRWPSGQAIAEMTGYSQRGANRWDSRLKAAGLWPDTRGLSPRRRTVDITLARSSARKGRLPPLLLSLEASAAACHPTGGQS